MIVLAEQYEMLAEHSRPIAGDMRLEQLTAAARSTNANKKVDVLNAVSVMRKFLIGQRILVVEDNGLVAADTSAILEDAGAEVIAAPRIREAVDVAARADLSAAVVDIDIAGAECTPVCEILDRRRVPFVFYTGQYHHHVMDRWPHAPILLKPALADDLLDCVERALQRLQHA